MDQVLAESLARQLRIAVEQVVREAYELLILQHLMESPIGRSFVFKGGTALRLAYGSPRFSDDLDFSQRVAVAEADFVRVTDAIAQAIPQVTLAEVVAKHFTLLADFKVRETFLPRAFPIKVELSTRAERWERERDFSLRLLTSPVTPVTALAQVSTLERIRADKQSALASRRQPRDVYDLWFIAQALRQPFTPDLTGFDARIVRRELHKYLPQSQWSVVDQWTA